MMDNIWSANLLSIDSLGKCFIKHLLAINNTTTPVIGQALWQDIVKNYDEPIRAYHNLNHLRQLFGQFEHVKSRLQQPSIVALALFYHDIIYDPTQQDNELKSAEYAKAHLKGYLTIEQCQRIYNLIMMTANHQLEDKDGNISDGEILDSDATYLLDMDLSILAADWVDYQRYAQAVRQEYAHVASDDYRTGRITVLKGLLAHDRLYLTDDYYERLEQQARQNIGQEIEILT